ncbi:MAG: 50S ribosomal protein L32 [Candidatus Omnitrophica bacterium]|nr:50S ribosomal protein L32 [Candidatus Omnitrophota bacterium]
MAVPKRRQSKSRKNKRRNAHPLTPPQMVKCSHCGSLKRPHHLCPHCGYYANRQIVEVKK